MPTIEQIKELRHQTGVSISECKKALDEAKGDFEQAKELLRKWGKELAGKKATREAGVGVIDSYVHPNKKTGVMLDIRCESDFVAMTDDFKNLAHEICLQITAMNPLYLKEEEIAEKVLQDERKIYQEQFKDSGKTKKIMDGIIDGKIKKYKEERSLMSQRWIKDDSKTIKDLTDSYIAKTGENIVIKKFTRYEI